MIFKIRGIVYDCIKYSVHMGSPHITILFGETIELLETESKKKYLKNIS